MSLGNLILALICGATALYVLVLIAGMIALFPFGLIGLAVLAVMGFGLWRVVNQKLSDKENRYYEDNIEE